MKTLIIIGTPIVLIIFLVASWYHRHPCIKSHVEMVHHSSYTTVVMVGKMFIPQFHPGYDNLETICDERK